MMEKRISISSNPASMTNRLGFFRRLKIGEERIWARLVKDAIETNYAISASVAPSHSA